jgi:hypothetical protein
MRLVTFHRGAFVGRYVGEKARATCPVLVDLLLRLLDHGSGRRLSIDAVENVPQRTTGSSATSLGFPVDLSTVTRS